LTNEVKWFINLPQPKDDSVDSSSSNVPRLTKEQKTYNTQHKNARNKVELPFGWIKQTFKSLEKPNPWQESEEQMDYCVGYAVGLWNMRMVKNK